MISEHKVFIPLGWWGARLWHQHGGCPDGVQGVVPDLRDHPTDPDEIEQREYDALWIAAETPAARRAHSSTDSTGRVLVALIEMPGVAPDAHGFAPIPTGLSWDDVACVYAHEIDADPDDELLWFSADEAPQLWAQA